jgi:hypothetical protein
MEPSGNIPYDVGTALMREDQDTTEQALRGLGWRFINFLELHLDRIVGQARIKLAKENPQIQHAKEQRDSPAEVGRRIETIGRSTAPVPDKETEFELSDDYCVLFYQGQQYSLTRSAGQIISLLHEAYRDGKPSLNSAELKRRAKCAKVWHQFRRRDGRKVWELLIRRTEKDFFCLNLPPAQRLLVCGAVSCKVYAGKITKTLKFAFPAPSGKVT